MSRKKKYLAKNEFRYNMHPDVVRKDGKGHISYVSAKQGHKAKVNVITHSKVFYGEPTYPLKQNPDRESTYKTQSYYSKPVWQSDSYLSKPNSGYWKLSKADRIAIKKTNKKFK